MTALLLFFLPLRSAGGKPEVPPRELADRIIDAAMLYIGSPYQYHASGPNAFDCSGFTSFIFKQYGIDLPHSSADQAKTGREVDGLPSHLQKGDLVFFSGRRKSSTVGHVGIFIEATDGGKSFRFIHAARGGVMVSELKEDFIDLFTHLSGGLNHVPERSLGFSPATGLESAVGVDPELYGADYL